MQRVFSDLYMYRIFRLLTLGRVQDLSKDLNLTCQSVPFNQAEIF
jgi:hypothetical protein